MFSAVEGREQSRHISHRSFLCGCKRITNKGHLDTNRQFDINARGYAGLIGTTASGIYATSLCNYRNTGMIRCSWYN